MGQAAREHDTGPLGPGRRGRPLRLAWGGLRLRGQRAATQGLPAMCVRAPRKISSRAKWSVRAYFTQKVEVNARERSCGGRRRRPGGPEDSSLRSEKRPNATLGHWGKPSSIARASRARDTAATCTQSTGGRSRATSLFDSRSDRRERRERRRSPEEILSTTHRDLREQTLCLAPGEPAGLPSVAVLSSEERGPMAPFRRPRLAAPTPESTASTLLSNGADARVLERL